MLVSSQGVDITSMSANRGLICVGDADGFVHLANRSLEARKFQAHELFVSHVVMVRRRSSSISISPALTPSCGCECLSIDEAQQRAGDYR
jgi:hypothetical protein